MTGQVLSHTYTSHHQSHSGTFTYVHEPSPVTFWYFHIRTRAITSHILVLSYTYTSHHQGMLITFYVRYFQIRTHMHTSHHQGMEITFYANSGTFTYAITYANNWSRALSHTHTRAITYAHSMRQALSHMHTHRSGAITYAHSMQRTGQVLTWHTQPSNILHHHMVTHSHIHMASHMPWPAKVTYIW